MKQIKQIFFHDRFFTDFDLRFISRTAGRSVQAHGPSEGINTLFIVFSGRGSIQTGSTSFELKKGQWILFSPGRSISCRPAPGQELDYIRIGFGGNRASHIFSSVGIGFDSPFSQTDGSQMEHLTAQLFSFCTSSLEGALLRQAIACRILADLTENSMPKPGDNRRAGLNSYVSEAADYIARHYQEPLSVQKLADSLGITRNYLFTLFQKELNCSPSHYLLEFRLSRARELLRQTEYSAEDIAISCGYQDPVVFSRAFSKHYGLSPTAYRTSISGR